MIAVIDATLAPGLLGAYLYGSAVDGGLRADSDLDLLAVVERRLTDAERRAIVDGLLPLSGRATRPASWRPVELTLVVRDDVRPWLYPPRFELQYGEWLRADFLSGDLEPWPLTNPDVAILLTMVLERGEAVIGPPCVTCWTQSRTRTCCAQWPTDSRPCSTISKATRGMSS